jgi:hypothetical protein
MRNYENIGYDAFNSYRSGDENSRRNRYGTTPSNERGGSSVYGRSSRDTSSADHNFSTEPGFYGTGSAGRNQSPQQPQNQRQQQPQSNQNYNENSRYQQSRPQSQGNWEQQNRSSNYGNSQNYNRNQSRENRAGNWADQAEDRIERWGDKIENAWDRWSGDENNQVRQNWMNHPEHYPTQSHGNAMGNRYSENYDNSSNRFENRGSYGNQGRRREEDEGFFDNLGHRISNAWDRWVGNDEDEERRYQQRSQFPSQGRRDENRNPYGQSPRRGDNEW